MKTLVESILHHSFLDIVILIDDRLSPMTVGNNFGPYRGGTITLMMEFPLLKKSVLALTNAITRELLKINTINNTIRRRKQASIIASSLSILLIRFLASLIN